MADRRYWDAACFIAVLNEEEGRVEECESVLRAAANREVEIVTSAFTITEVLYPKGGRPLPPDLRKIVSTYFRRPEIVIVNVDRELAEAAQRFFWDFGVRPKDAVHVASALRGKASVLETYDDKLIDLDRKLGGSPPLKVRRPVAIIPPASNLDLLRLDEI